MPNQAYLPPADGECILPDDDDCHIINNEPTIVPTNKPVIINRSLPGERVQKNLQPILLNSSTNGSPGMAWRIVSNPIEQTARSTPSQQKKSTTQQTHIIKIAGNIIKDMTSYDISKPPNPQTNPVLDESNDLICLDSDEEESITPHIEPPKQKNKCKPLPKSTEQVRPILGSLRAVGPDGQMIPVVPHTKISAITATNPPKKIYTVIKAKRRNNGDTPEPTMDTDKGVINQTNVLRITPTGELVMNTRNNQGDNQIIQHQGFVTPSSQVVEKALVPEKTPVTEMTYPLETAPVPEKAQSPKDTVELDEVSVSEKDDVIRIHNESSSDSDSLRSTSPYDPLSILKDVVHIRAAEETPRKFNNKDRHIQRKVAEKSKVATHERKKQHNRSGNKQSSSSSNLLKGKVEMNVKNTEKLIRKANAVIDLDGKTKSGNSNDSNKNTIDLTETAASSTTSRDFKDKQQIKKSESVNISGVKVVGTTKNLVFQGKSITTNDGSASKQLVT